MTTLYLISWTVIVFGNYSTMDDCHAVEERINNETYYSEFRTLCLDSRVFNATRRTKDNRWRGARTD